MLCNLFIFILYYHLQKIDFGNSFQMQNDITNIIV